MIAVITLLSPNTPIRLQTHIKGINGQHRVQWVPTAARQQAGLSHKARYVAGRAFHAQGELVSCMT
jgi:hypothetical protein